MWEGSPTVVYTVVWRNSVVWWSTQNAALRLVYRNPSLEIVTGHIPKKRVSRPVTTQYSALIIKPRNFAKRQCKLQWLAPPISRRPHVIGTYCFHESSHGTRGSIRTRCISVWILQKIPEAAGWWPGLTWTQDPKPWNLLTPQPKTRNQNPETLNPKP